MTTISTQGVFRNGRIELDGDIGVPEGTRLSMTLEPARLQISREEMLRLADELAGSCADDPTFGEAVEQAVRERAMDVPREINFDDLDATP